MPLTQITPTDFVSAMQAGDATADRRTAKALQHQQMLEARTQLQRQRELEEMALIARERTARRAQLAAEHENAIQQAYRQAQLGLQERAMVLGQERAQMSWQQAAEKMRADEEYRNMALKYGAEDRAATAKYRAEQAASSAKYRQDALNARSAPRGMSPSQSAQGLLELIKLESAAFEPDETKIAELKRRYEGMISGGGDVGQTFKAGKYTVSVAGNPQAPAAGGVTAEAAPDPQEEPWSASFVNAQGKRIDLGGGGKSQGPTIPEVIEEPPKVAEPARGIEEAAIPEELSGVSSVRMPVASAPLPAIKPGELLGPTEYDDLISKGPKGEQSFDKRERIRKASEASRDALAEILDIRDIEIASDRPGEKPTLGFRNMVRDLIGRPMGLFDASRQAEVKRLIKEGKINEQSIHPLILDYVYRAGLSAIGLDTMRPGALERLKRQLRQEQ